MLDQAKTRLSVVLGVAIFALALIPQYAFAEETSTTKKTDEIPLFNNTAPTLPATGGQYGLMNGMLLGTGPGTVDTSRPMQDLKLVQQTNNTGTIAGSVYMGPDPAKLDIPELVIPIPDTTVRPSGGPVSQVLQIPTTTLTLTQKDALNLTKK